MNEKGIEALPSMAYVHRANEVLSGMGRYGEGAVRELEGLKQGMEDAGFASPFRGLVQRTMEEAGEMNESEWADLKKQAAYFRYIANLKKYSLARVGIALDAHRIAKGFLRMGYEDIVGHLPLDGNHIRLLMDAGDEGILAYREMSDRLEQHSEKRGCFLAKVKFHGETETVQVEAGEKLEMKVMRMFGVDAEIISTRPSFRKVPIISSRGVRIALVSAIVHYAAKSVGRMMGEGAGKAGEYNLALAKFGVRPDVRMDQVKGFAELKSELLRGGFLAKKGGECSMEEGLRREIAARKRRRKEETLRRSALLLLSPMFKFYLMNNEEGRRKENLYPSLAVVPGEGQLMLFSYMEAEGLPARSILKRKIAVEGSVPLSGKELGAALLMGEGGKDPSWASEYLGIEKGKAENALEVLRNFSKGKRGVDFVGRIRNG